MGDRVTMERIGQLEPRISVLEDDFDEEALEAEAGNAEAAAVNSISSSQARAIQEPLRAPCIEPGALQNFDERRPVFASKLC